MKTVGQAYQLSEFESGDVGAFVLGKVTTPFVVTAPNRIKREHWHMDMPENPMAETRYLGRGRIEPARIVMEGEK